MMYFNGTTISQTNFTTGNRMNSHSGSIMLCIANNQWMGAICRKLAIHIVLHNAGVFEQRTFTAPKPRRHVRTRTLITKYKFISSVRELVCCICICHINIALGTRPKNVIGGCDFSRDCVNSTATTITIWRTTTIKPWNWAAGWMGETNPVRHSCMTRYSKGFR